MKKIISSFLLFALSYSLGFAQKNVLVKVLGNKQLPEQGLEQGLSSSGKTAGLELLTPAAVRGVLGGHSVPGLASGAEEVVLRKEILKKSILQQNSFNPLTLAAVEKNIDHSLVAILDTKRGIVEASGFLFKDYRGKIWAALPHHVAGQKGTPVSLRLRLQNDSWQVLSTRVGVAGTGDRIGVDLSLVSIPENLYAQVLPLKWAVSLPELGSFSDSFGFYLSRDLAMAPRMVRGRKLLKTSLYRNVTTFKPELGKDRGACGSPLLNGRGQVVGMHIWHEYTGVSATLNRNGLDLLLQLYYTGQSTVPLVINGHKVGDLSVTEKAFMFEVTPRRGGPVQRLGVAAEDRFTYDKLEEFAPFSEGDHVRVFIRNEKNETRTWDFIVP